MYRFMEIVFDPVDWPDIRGIRVYKDGKPQRIGDMSAGTSIHDWVHIISKHQQYGHFFKDYPAGCKDFIVREVARTGENILEDLEKDFPKYFI